MSFTATMEDTIVVAATRSPLKRPLPDDVTPNASPASCHIMQSVEQSAGFPTPPLTTSPGDGQQEDTHRTASPAPSSSALSSVAPSTADGVHGISAQNTPGSATQPPKKRRKLTVVEKEEQRRAKELREAEKAEKKVQREREQAVKDEEKRVKAEERRTRNEEKDAKKREVEVKKQQKVEEEVKKERVSEPAETAHLSTDIVFSPNCVYNLSSQSPKPPPRLLLFLRNLLRQKLALTWHWKRMTR